MNCQKCGNKLIEGSKFCGECGAQQSAHPVAITPKKKSTIIISIILSIILLTVVLYPLFASKPSASKPSATDIINSETFINVNFDAMRLEYKDNSYRTEEKYKGQYVVFMGEVRSIREDYLYLEIDTPKGIAFADCYYYEGVAEDSLLKSLSVGDIVTIKGKFKTVLEYDYDVETYSIQKN